MRPANTALRGGELLHNELHIDNIQEDEFKEIHEDVKNNSKTCLLAAFPSCTVLDPMQVSEVKMKVQSSLV